MTEQKKIFITEDEETLREVCKVRFEKAGFSVSLFKDGLELLQGLSTDTPDVVLLDLNMPEMNGFEVLQTIHKNFEDQKKQDVTVIVWSNLNNDEDIQKAKKLGATAYLRKIEYLQDNLVDKVQEIMAQKK